jgi:hypothetical protein
MASAEYSAIPFAFPDTTFTFGIGKPPSSEPTDDSHRFYLCEPAMNAKYRVCTKGSKDAIRSRVPGAVERERKMGNTGFPIGRAISISKGCPEVFDKFTLTFKLNAPVTIKK